MNYGLKLTLKRTFIILATKETNQQEALSRYIPRSTEFLLLCALGEKHDYCYIFHNFAYCMSDYMNKSMSASYCFNIWNKRKELDWLSLRTWILILSASDRNPIEDMTDNPTFDCVETGCSF